MPLTWVQTSHWSWQLRDNASALGVGGCTETINGWDAYLTPYYDDYPFPTLEEAKAFVEVTAALCGS